MHPRQYHTAKNRDFPPAGELLTAEDFGLVKAAYPVDEWCEITSMRKTRFYASVKAGDLKLTKLGAKSLILTPDGVAFLNLLRSRSLVCHCEAA